MEGLGLTRVALLAPCYWPEVRRGTERFARELADGLIADGHRPTLITSHPRRLSRTVEDGMRVVRLPRPPHARLDRRGYEQHLTHLPLSAAAVAAARPDVAHALYPADALAARAARRPVVLSYMGIPDAGWLAGARLRRRILTAAVRGVDAVVALSEAAAVEFRRTLGVDARVIAPGVDTAAFAPGGRRDERPTIVCAAALDAPQKRVGELVEAFALVRRVEPDARLVLSRPPPGVPVFEREGVEFADLDDRAALAAAYRRAWISALPSMGEAFGLVLVESMACGTPVVARRTGATPEVVNADDVGVLYDGGPPALAAALLEGLDRAHDPVVAAACRARAMGFSVRRCVDAYESLYEELLDG